ncbi:Fc receptor-like protein 4 isoform X1 [Lynx canadensis]|uniref:Fc receptor-like protein 4 isoform X1 n=1 Tax=Lynx canadensis TaxID=61383 RepID=UPI0011B03F59|nr:Fc receptor-like protein 4 isoform X1 [Lynx canadensis]
MLLWASLLVLAPVCGQLEAASKPVISLHPPWTVAFRGETVTLTCNVLHLHAPEKIKRFLWYLGRRTLRETPGNTLEVRDSGQYRCQTQDSLPSDQVNMIFSSGWLVLQTPHGVFEGDTLVLRCRTRSRETLTSVKYIWNRKVISASNQSQDLSIPRASSNNSGFYHCTGRVDKMHTWRSNTKSVQVQELFPHPKLKVTPSQPTEGGSVNLSCETQLPPERPDTVLHFSFFGDRRVVLSDWSRSPELQITAIWRQDAGSYTCGAAAAQGVHKLSLPVHVYVQGVPVSRVLLETQPPEGRALAGEPLVLICSAAEGTGDTTFSWHREDTGESLGRKRRRSQRAQLEIPAVGGSHAGGYFCTADNGHGLACSSVLNVTVTGTPGNRMGLIAAGATGGLLSVLVLAAGLLIYRRHQRKSGDGSPGNTTRSSPATGPGQAPHGRCQGQKDSPVELQHLYGNGSLGEGHLVYSEIQTIRPGQEGEGKSLGKILVANYTPSFNTCLLSTPYVLGAAVSTRSRSADKAGGNPCRRSLDSKERRQTPKDASCIS